MIITSKLSKSHSCEWMRFLAMEIDIFILTLWNQSTSKSCNIVWSHCYSMTSKIQLKHHFFFFLHSCVIWNFHLRKNKMLNDGQSFLSVKLSDHLWSHELKISDKSSWPMWPNDLFYMHSIIKNKMFTLKLTWPVCNALCFTLTCINMSFKGQDRVEYMSFSINLVCIFHRCTSKCKQKLLCLYVRVAKL